MPPDDVSLRTTFGLAAIAGGLVFGLYSLAESLLAGQPVHRRDYILAVANVSAAILTGSLVAYFTGPVLAPLIPMEGLRDPHAVGFAIGALAWEGLPFIFKAARALAAKKSAEVGQ